MPPVKLKPRPLPFAKRERAQRQIEAMEKDGILTKIRYSPWQTPLVAIEKNDGSFRLCADYRLTTNLAIILDQYPLPTLDELFAKMSGNRVWSRVDLTSAFLQLPVDEPSALAQAITTPFGLYKVNVLNFGISSAPSIFQNFITAQLADFQANIAVLLDDILLGAPNHAELKVLEDEFFEG